ncbi:MAG TPA: hypothetical protein VFZ91_00215 [Allosphingosinicella sp.]
MRPTSIIRFEQLYLLSLTIGLVIAIFGWEQNLATARASGLGVGIVVAVQALTLGLMLLLILYVSRRASVVAKWILIVLFVAGLAIMAMNVETLFRGGIMLFVQIGQILLQLAAMYFLFTPEARRWFEGTAPDARV